jgi:hypothetical protein
MSGKRKEREDLSKIHDDQVMSPRVSVEQGDHVGRKGAERRVRLAMRYHPESSPVLPISPCTSTLAQLNRIKAVGWTPITPTGITPLVEEAAVTAGTGATVKTRAGGRDPVTFFREGWPQEDIFTIYEASAPKETFLMRERPLDATDFQRFVFTVVDSLATGTSGMTDFLGASGPGTVEGDRLNRSRRLDKNKWNAVAVHLAHVDKSAVEAAVSERFQAQVIPAFAVVHDETMIKAKPRAGPKATDWTGNSRGYVYIGSKPQPDGDKMLTVASLLSRSNRPYLLMVQSSASVAKEGDSLVTVRLLRKLKGFTKKHGGGQLTVADSWFATKTFCAEATSQSSRQFFLLSMARGKVGDELVTLASADLPRGYQRIFRHPTGYLVLVVHDQSGKIRVTATNAWGDRSSAPVVHPVADVAQPVSSSASASSVSSAPGPVPEMRSLGVLPVQKLAKILTEEELGVIAGNMAAAGNRPLVLPDATLSSGRPATGRVQTVAYIANRSVDYVAGATKKTNSSSLRQGGRTEPARALQAATKGKRRKVEDIDDDEYSEEAGETGARTDFTFRELAGMAEARRERVISELTDKQMKNIRKPFDFPFGIIH